jgi:hypothetical protein
MNFQELKQLCVFAICVALLAAGAAPGQRGEIQRIGNEPLRIEGAKLATQGDAAKIAIGFYDQKMIGGPGLSANEGVQAMSTIKLGYDIPGFANRGEQIWTATAMTQNGEFRGLMWIHPNTEKVLPIVGAWDAGRPDNANKNGTSKGPNK